MNILNNCNIAILDVEMDSIKLQELLDYLNAYLKVADFKDYGPNGLQLQGKGSLRKIAFTPSASLEAIEEALENKADLICVHHGLFWDKDPRGLVGPLYEKVKKLMQREVSLLAYHLPLDAHPQVGNNFVTLRNLGLSQLESFEEVGAQGRGELSFEQLVKNLEEMFGTSLRTPPCKKKILHRVACISGGAHSAIKAAFRVGCDAFITGTSDEWVWDFAKETGMAFFPLGHYRSEKVGIKALMDHVGEKFKIQTLWIDTQNPY